MAQNFGNIGSAQAATAQGAGLPSTAIASGTGNFQKDATESSTAPKFGDILKRIQAQYGAKAEKPREIKKTLGKDDFLRIMITQMQHQDPTNPFKAEQMAAEMAQFTSVEQLKNMNESLNKFMHREDPMQHLAMTSLIGKSITVDRNRFPHTEGGNDSLDYTLPRDAAQVHVALINGDTGEAVLEKDLGPQKAGQQTFTWDGLKSNSLAAKAGNYMFRVEAKDDRGHDLPMSSVAKMKVVGVSFEGAEPVFLVGDAAHQAKVTMKNIVRIDEDFNSLAGAPSQESAAAPASAAPNLIAFQKGVGSSTLDPAQLAPEAARAIERYESGQGDASASPAARPAEPAPAEEKGFPNGLHD